MKNVILAILIVMMLPLVSCSLPSVDIQVGFEDNVISLDRETNEFKEIADEAISVYRHVDAAAECYFGLEEIEDIKRDIDFVEIGFNEVVEVPTSVQVNDLEEEIRDKHGRKTTEDGYIISELLSAIFSHIPIIR